MAKKHSCINVKASEDGEDGEVEGISLSTLPLPIPLPPMVRESPPHSPDPTPHDLLYLGMYQLADASDRNLPYILNVVINRFFCLHIEYKTSNKKVSL